MSFLSLLGLPPLAGFVGKLELFAAAIDADQAWLAVVAVVNTVISLYYYLLVIAPAVLEQPDAAVMPARPRARPGSLAIGVALAVTSVATVGFGVGAEPLLSVADRAAMLLGPGG